MHLSIPCVSAPFSVFALLFVLILLVNPCHINIVWKAFQGNVDKSHSQSYIRTSCQCDSNSSVTYLCFVPFICKVWCVNDFFIWVQVSANVLGCCFYGCKCLVCVCVCLFLNFLLCCYTLYVFSFCWVVTSCTSVLEITRLPIRNWPVCKQGSENELNDRWFVLFKFQDYIAELNSGSFGKKILVVDTVSQ